MIKWFKHNDNKRFPPQVSGCTIEVMKFPTSKLIAETDKYVSIDYIPPSSDPLVIPVYHFMKVGSSWVSCTWADLSDCHRLAFRTKILTIKTDMYRDRYVLDGYEDNRYYTLEALCD